MNHWLIADHALCNICHDELSKSLECHLKLVSGDTTVGALTAITRMICTGFSITICMGFWVCYKP